MKEENVREWGKIHPLGILSLTPDGILSHQDSPTPENLIYHFTPPFCPSQAEAVSPTAAVTGLSLLPRTRYFHEAEPTIEDEAQALTLPYGHPRFIEYFDEEPPQPRRARRFLPILLAAVSAFVVWYVYHLTGQQLKLQTDVKTYQESIALEQRAKADLVAARTKVLTFEERERGTTTAKLFWDTEEQAGQLYLDHLPDAATHETYQLWFLTKDTRFVRAHTFRAVQGKAVMKIKLPPSMGDQVDRIVVSLEPPDQQAFPVGKILLRGRLQ